MVEYSNRRLSVRQEHMNQLHREITRDKFLKLDKKYFNEVKSELISLGSEKLVELVLSEHHHCYDEYNKLRDLISDKFYNKHRSIEYRRFQFPDNCWDVYSDDQRRMMEYLDSITNQEYLSLKKKNNICNNPRNPYDFRDMDEMNDVILKEVV